MSAARLTLPLDPARTDADWADDLTFYRDDLDTPEDWSGCEASLALVPRSAVLRGTASFVLTSQAGGGLEILDHGVGIRVSALAMAERVPGTYDFELRKFAGDAVEAVLVGSVSIEQGLSEIAAGELATGPVALSGGIGGVRVVRGTSAARIVRGGGVAGPPGPGVAAQVSFDDTIAQLGATDAQAAFEALVLRIKALEQGQPPPTDGTLDFSQDGNPFIAAL